MKNFEIHENPNKLVLAGLFAALGLVLPFVTGHALGMRGTILLPMHFAVLLCGLICGAKYGALCGALVPILSNVLTGMPPTVPMLPALVCELSLYGALSGWAYKTRKLSVYVSMLISIVVGRITNALVLAAMLGLCSGGFKALAAFYSVVSGLPGIMFQFALVPFIVNFAEKNLLRAARRSNALPDGPLDKARALIASGDISCVVIKDGVIIHTADGRGVSPVLALYQKEPEKLKGSFLVDRIIGKAGAMILCLGGVGAVFAEVMSVSADRYLAEHGIPHSCGRCVDMISNREGNGICPIERSVLDTDDAHEGYESILATVKVLMAKKAAAEKTAS